MKSYKLSRRDIRFLTVIYKINKIMALVPSYDFQKSKVVSPVLDKIRAASVTCIIIFGSVASLIVREESYTYSMKHKVLDYINELFLIALFVIALTKSVSHEKWTSLNNNFQLLDKKFNSRNHEATFAKNVYVHYFSYHILFFVTVCYIMYIWYMELGSSSARSYLIHDIIHFYDFHIHLLVYNIARAFHCRYVDFNELIAKSCPAMVNVKELESISLRLHEMVQTFNEIFGWTLLFIIGRSVVQLLNSLSFITTGPDMLLNQQFRQNLFVGTICLAAFILLITTIVTLSCDSVKAESEKTAFLCYKLRDEAENEDTRKKLLHLARFVARNSAKFTAADFYVVDRGTLLQILGITTTYFIVIIQFH